MVIGLSSPKLQAQVDTGKKRRSHEKSLKLKAWQYKALGDSLWRDCSAPSLVQENLIKDKLLPLPYIADKEKQVQWVSEKDWLYQTSFQINKPITAERPLFLDFDGLDTYCTITLNGEKLGEADNMFRAYRYNISKAVHQGDNKLVLHFHAPIKKAYPQYLSNGFNYPADNDHAKEHLSPFTRKAPYHYGWDWGMRLLTMGIWQDVRLTQYNQLALRDISIDTNIKWKGKKAQSVSVSLKPDIERFSKQKIYYTLRIISPKGKVTKLSSQSYEDKAITFTIKDPELWWTKAWGKANLYRVELKLWDEHRQKLLASKSKTFGIRELEFINERDDLGRSFYFKLNKEPLFIKGANYVPNEQILTIRKPHDFDKLFESIAFANINMIRVWGGGIYEVDEFYNIADEEGILIWQDFMFACTPYPSDEAFLKNVEQEAVYQVKRLRNHPCIALWCGNNEIKEALKYWGWQGKFSKEHYEAMKQSYKPLFEELLPKVVKQYAPQSYIHGSPMEANWGRPKSFTFGDSHYWGLWYGQEDFSTFDEKPLRFVSEFGFQAFPHMKTIKAFAQEDDYHLNSNVMNCHQKASTGNSLIKKYMKQAYRVPDDFADFVYMNNVLQMEGMEYVMRTLRRQRPTCMGAMYWQLNDSWPAISWSGIDYFGNYKGLHYAARRAFAPVNLSYYQNKQTNELELFINNDLRSELKDIEIRYKLIDFYGKSSLEQKIALDKVKANSSKCIERLNLSMMGGQEVCAIELWQEDKLLDRLYFYKTKTIDLDLPRADYEVAYSCQRDGYATLRVKAKTLIKNFYLDIAIQGLFISDNFFDLLPNEERIIELRSPMLKKGAILPVKTDSMQEVVERIPVLCKEPMK